VPVLDVAFEAIEDGEPRLIRQTDIEDIAGPVVFREVQRLLAFPTRIGTPSRVTVAQDAAKVSSSSTPARCVWCPSTHRVVIDFARRVAVRRRR